MPRQRDRWSNSLESDTSEARGCVPYGWKPWIHWQRLDQWHLERKQQNQIPVLSEFSRKIFCTYEPFKVTQEEKRLNLRWWGHECILAHLEPVCVPQRLFVRSQVHIGCRNHRRRARRSWEQTNSILHTIKPTGYRGRIILWWPHEAQKSSLQNRVEILSKRRLLDPPWEGTGERHGGNRNRMQSSPGALFHQTVSNEWSHNAEKWLFTSDLQHHDLHHALSLKVHGMSKSSKRQPAVPSIQGVAGNCSRTETMVNTRLFKELWETAASTLSSKKETRFRSISEFLEFHKTSSTKMRDG